MVIPFFAAFVPDVCAQVLFNEATKGSLRGDTPDTPVLLKVTTKDCFRSKKN